MFRPLLASAIGAVALTIAACGGSRVEVVSTTTSPSTSAASAPSPPAPATRQFRGTIDRIDAANRVLVIAGTTVAVPASATIRNAAGSALAFTDLHVGDIVSVSGTEAAGVVTATAVVVDAPAPSASTVAISGRVAAVSGICPTLTFAVSDTTVTTTAATVMTGGSCTQIANGIDVEVTGTRQADRSVVATQVTIRR